MTPHALDPHTPSRTRKKILYIITKSNWGGAQRYVFDLASHFSKTCDVAVISGPTGLLHDKLKEVGIRTVGIPSLQRDVNPFFDIKTFFILLRIFAQEKPDVIHLNSSKIGGIGAVAGRVYGLRGRTKIIFTAHGWAFNEERNRLSKFIIKFLHWITVLLCHQTVAVAEMTRRQLANWPFMKKSMTVIYNGISREEVAALYERDTARAKLIERVPALKNHSRSLWIGTTSELHPNKGLIYLINAVNAISKLPVISPTADMTPFVCVIMGEGGQRKVLEVLIAEKGCSEKIVLAGYVEGASQYARAFDILTLTSVTEAFPYALIEAGAAERAVIASAVGGIPEIIDTRRSGILVQPRNEKEIQSALSFFISHPEKREEYGKALAQKVATTFSKDDMYKKTAHMYDL